MWWNKEPNIHSTFRRNGVSLRPFSFICIWWIRNSNLEYNTNFGFGFSISESSCHFMAHKIIAALFSVMVELNSSILLAYIYRVNLPFSNAEFLIWQFQSFQIFKTNRIFNLFCQVLNMFIEFYIGKRLWFDDYLCADIVDVWPNVPLRLWLWFIIVFDKLKKELLKYAAIHEMNWTFNRHYIQMVQVPLAP